MKLNSRWRFKWKSCKCSFDTLFGSSCAAFGANLSSMNVPRGADLWTFFFCCVNRLFPGSRCINWERIYLYETFFTSKLTYLNRWAIVSKWNNWCWHLGKYFLHLTKDEWNPIVLFTDYNFFFTILKFFYNGFLLRLYTCTIKTSQILSSMTSAIACAINVIIQPKGIPDPTDNTRAERAYSCLRCLHKSLHLQIYFSWS